MDGIINVYKERGYTSFDVVAKLRGILHERRIGHTGTLDPEAEGVLPVCVGQATKACELLLDKDKEYEAVILFGLETDTQDITGRILSSKVVTADAEEAQRALLSFVGTYQQIPPMYSALKVNGRKLYELA
ncbi:MAG: tRNA pseudouridine(55) synthase TruB, partial [Lachnospiraceae bacterium]|nr:tRNA pseudouridine(55) synthase TruB [Lachnospiraceae bacterium]